LTASLAPTDCWRSVAIEDALTAGVSGKKIEQAQKFLALGDSKTAGGCGSGIQEYAEAWKFASSPRDFIAISVGECHMRFGHSKRTGERIIVQVSSNLTDWVSVGNGTSDAEGNLIFEDAEAGGNCVRYYRCYSN